MYLVDYHAMCILPNKCVVCAILENVKIYVGGHYEMLTRAEDFHKQLKEQYNFDDSVECRIWYDNKREVKQ